MYHWPWTQLVYVHACADTSAWEEAEGVMTASAAAITPAAIDAKMRFLSKVTHSWSLRARGIKDVNCAEIGTNGPDQSRVYQSLVEDAVIGQQYRLLPVATLMMPVNWRYFETRLSTVPGFLPSHSSEPLMLRIV